MYNHVVILFSKRVYFYLNFTAATIFLTLTSMPLKQSQGPAALLWLLPSDHNCFS